MRPFLIAVLVATIALDAEARRRAVRSPQPDLTITSVTPSSVSIFGGARITIRGTGFFGAIRISIDGQPPASSQVDSGTQITLVAPPHVSGYASVAVTSAQGRSTTEILYVSPPLADLPAGSITTVAGIGKYLGEGRSAREVPVSVADFDVRPDGTVYLAEPQNGVVRRVNRNGVIERVAGDGAAFAGLDIGDGGDALQATLASRPTWRSGRMALSMSSTLSTIAFGASTSARAFSPRSLARARMAAVVPRITSRVMAVRQSRRA